MKSNGKSCSIEIFIDCNLSPILITVMSSGDFPLDAVPCKQGTLGVRYFADASASMFLSSSKKVDRKLRYVELAKSSERYFLLIYKVKKNNTVPHFKIEIIATSTIKSTDRYSEFRFCIDDEDTAIFDLNDSELRNEWIDEINSIINTLNGIPPSPKRIPSGTLSPSKIGSPSAERSKSPIYAKSSINIMADTSSTSQDNQPTPSMNAPRGRLISSTASETPSIVGHVGLTEPVRRKQKHMESVSLGITGTSTPDSEQAISRSDTSSSLLHIGSVKTISDPYSSSFLNSPFIANNERGRAVSPITKTGSSLTSSSPSPHQKSTRVPPGSPGIAETGIGVGTGSGIGGLTGTGTGNPTTAPASTAEVTIGGDVLSPPRVPSMRSAHLPPTPPLSSDRLVTTTSSIGIGISALSQQQQTVDLTLSPDNTPTKDNNNNNNTEENIQQYNEQDQNEDEEDHINHHHDTTTTTNNTNNTTNNQSISILLQENHTLSLMNDELNEALERAECLLHASDDDHQYQIHHLNTLLDKAQSEPELLKLELNNIKNENNNNKIIINNQNNDIILLKDEIIELKQNLKSSQNLIINLEETIIEYQDKYSEYNINNLKNLENLLIKNEDIINNKDNEISELNNQIEIFNNIMKEYENNNNNTSNNNIEYINKQNELINEINLLKIELNNKDDNFLLNFNNKINNHLETKLIKLNNNIKNLTIEYNNIKNIKEKNELSKNHLENIIKQQENYIYELINNNNILNNELNNKKEQNNIDNNNHINNYNNLLNENNELKEKIKDLNNEKIKERTDYLNEINLLKNELNQYKDKEEKEILNEKERIDEEDSYLVSILSF